ncbi:MAG: transcriptional regulator, IclR family protein [Xanthobacteraceae bacterium]|nr:transcriptional regulator, IclR family protein [Xanthobacteraceae bacterium]
MDLEDDRDDDEQSRYIVPGLRRGLAVLRLFTRDRAVVSVPEISRELRISRATAFRLVYTLEADGYLQRTPHSHAFKLGVNVLSLGFEYLGSQDLLDIARPILENLRDVTDASAHMGLRDGTQVVYVLKAASQHRLRSNVSVGTRLALHATSIGQALLLDAPRDELDRLFEGFEMLQYSDQTPATVQQLVDKLDEHRPRGYVAYRSAYAKGIDSVAAPVRDARGNIVAGINVSDHESLPIMQEQHGRLKDLVMEAAAGISMQLGYRPPTRRQHG